MLNLYFYSVRFGAIDTKFQIINLNSALNTHFFGTPCIMYVIRRAFSKTRPEGWRGGDGGRGKELVWRGGAGKRVEREGGRVLFFKKRYKKVRRENVNNKLLILTDINLWHKVLRTFFNKQCVQRYMTAAREDFHIAVF